jgi:hypothetical protein
VVLLAALQPVQLVSMVAVPGETENVPPPPPPPPDADPPQPARSTKTGTAAAATIRAGQRSGKSDLCRCKGLSTRRPRQSGPGICGSGVTAGRWLNLGLNLRLNSSGAFPAGFLDNPC